MRLKKKEEIDLLALEQCLLEYYELPEYLVAWGLIAEGVTWLKGYVINLFSVGFANYSNDYGYWTCKEYFGDDIRYPGYEDDKHHENVKVYTSKKTSWNNVREVKEQVYLCIFFNSWRDRVLIRSTTIKCNEKAD